MGRHGGILNGVQGDCSCMRNLSYFKFAITVVIQHWNKLWTELGGTFSQNKLSGQLRKINSFTWESCRRQHQGLQMRSELGVGAGRFEQNKDLRLLPLRWKSSKRETKGRHFGTFVTSLRSILKGERSIFPLYLRLTKMQGKRQYFKRLEMITIAKRTARLTSTKTFFRDSSIHINEWSFSWSTFCAQGGQLMRKTNR